MSTVQKQKDILKTFESLQDWDAKYKKIIELGKKLPPFPEAHRKEENKVKGCQSQVWLYAELSPQQKLKFHADSDALIVKGLAALLVNVYSDSAPEEILETTPEFLKTLGLSSHLSPSRSNGLNAMLKQIHNYAVAFKIILNSKK